MTGQRRAILAVVRDAEDHPTADAVFRRVRRRLPRISLGTVYRNLELLAGEGLIQRLDLGEGRMRFDAVLTAHGHVSCVRCGRVEDVRDARIERVLARIGTPAGYEVLGRQLLLTGLCPDCRGRKSRRRSGDSPPTSRGR